MSDWTCIKCTTSNAIEIYQCSVCGAKNLNNTWHSTQPRYEERLSGINKYGLSKQQAVERLTSGYIDEVAEQYDLPEIPKDVERLIALFARISFEWIQNHLEGNFRLFGFMNECVQRTDKGKGCWENIFLSQTIESAGYHCMKLRVKEIGSGPVGRVIVGVIRSGLCDKYLPYRFNYYEDASGAELLCKEMGHIINVELDFREGIHFGELRIDGVLEKKIKKAQDYTYRFALAMGVSHVVLELIHYGA